MKCERFLFHIVIRLNWLCIRESHASRLDSFGLILYLSLYNSTYASHIVNQMCIGPDNQSGSDFQKKSKFVASGLRLI